ncbi:hypothetical protein O7608_07485 [Solwaraspora sp. WMMA2056]|uniref:hypothetical protein n=1 Tax=Solwaraspora sp. WMMA2056 TaxID=3015161 RepID=UPI00259BD753|nr:hypothetical protein [Solwaraspora sp. WMMA2056]WJK42220.1 hypothetical protein O7608_07485 [Solwaraspora sp. WMMA2056]
MSVDDIKASLVEANSLMAGARGIFLGATEVAEEGRSLADSACHDSGKGEVVAAVRAFNSAVQEIERAVRRFDSAIELADEYRGQL